MTIKVTEMVVKIKVKNAELLKKVRKRIKGSYLPEGFKYEMTGSGTIVTPNGKVYKPVRSFEHEPWGYGGAKSTVYVYEIEGKVKLYGVCRGEYDQDYEVGEKSQENLLEKLPLVVSGYSEGPLWELQLLWKAHLLEKGEYEVIKKSLENAVKEMTLTENVEYRTRCRNESRKTLLEDEEKLRKSWQKLTEFKKLHP